MSNLVSSSPTGEAQILLCRETRLVGTLPISYCLLRRPCSGLFIMTVSDGTDTRAAALGTRLLTAATVFTALSEGTVTPCTFWDILEDFNDDGVFQEISLQSDNSMV